jgi:hypothetical protein
MSPIWIRYYNFFLNRSKCAFGVSKIEYLGHIVSNVVLKKIEEMKDWPCPKTLKILQGFLGIIGHYRNFIKNYGNIFSPLTALRKKKSNGMNMQIKTSEASRMLFVQPQYLHFQDSLKLLFWNVMY